MMFQSSIFRALSGHVFKYTYIRPLTQQRHCSIYEPPYLDKGPQVERYSLLHIRLRAYDYPVLESFSKHVHRLVRTLNIDNDAILVPSRCGKVTLFKPNSSTSAQEYELRLYERTIKIKQVPSTTLPLMLELIQNYLPEGVHFTLKQLEQQEEDFRFVPNTELLAIRKEVEDVLENIREYRNK